jgi:hypothetical protein
MKTSRISIQVVSALLVLTVLMTACGGVPSGPTVTVEGGTCSYTGPQKVPVNLSMTWNVKDTTPGMDYGFSIITLAEGKTLKDLTALIGSSGPGSPSWVTMIDWNLMTQGTSTGTYDLTANSAYHGEPIYIACFKDDTLFGAAGPIQVTQ